MKKLYIICGIVLVIIVSVLITKRISPTQEQTAIKNNNKSISKKEPNKPRPTEKIVFPQWRLFTTQYFSIQYPRDTDLVEVEPTKVPTTGTIESTANNEDADNQYSVNIVALKINNISLQQYAENARDGSRVECNRNASISSLQKIIFNSKDSFMFSTTNCLQSNQISTQYYAPYEDGIIQLTTIVTGNIFQRVIYQNTIKKILSTVRIY